MLAPRPGEIDAEQFLQRVTSAALQATAQLALQMAAGETQATGVVDLADQAVNQTDQRFSVPLMGQELLLEPPLLGDILRGAQDSDDQLPGFVPLRPASVAPPAPMATSVPDPILRRSLLAREQPLGATLHDAQVGGLDQARPATQGFDLGHAIAGQAGESAGCPVEDQPAIGIDTQAVDAIGGQPAERI